MKFEDVPREETCPRGSPAPGMGGSPARPRCHSERRRRRWIRSKLQLGIVLVTFSVASLAVAVSLLCTSIGLSRLAENPAATVNGVLGQAQSLLYWGFAVALCVVAPLSVWVGLVFMFKVAGPIYRFKRYFLDVRGGSWDVACRLRQGDDLQDVKDAINGAMEVLRGALRRQHDLLARAQRRLRDATAPSAGREEIQDLLREMEITLQDVGPRLGFPPPASPEPAAPVQQVEAGVSCGG